MTIKGTAQVNTADIRPNDGTTSASSPVKNFVPTTLRVVSLTLFALFTALCIVGLELLNYFSRKNGGLRTINIISASEYLKNLSHTRSTLSQLSKGSFFWTALPTFIGNVINALWTAVVADLLFRQPLVELSKREGSTSSHSIALDYTSYILPVRVWKLMQNQHLFCLFAIFVALLTSYAITPIASALFVTREVVKTVGTGFVRTTTFMGNVDVPNLNLVPIMQLASSIRVFMTMPIFWTDANYAFDQFSLVDKSYAQPNSVLQGKTTAYRAQLDCTHLSSPVISMTSSTISFNAMDRGCNLTIKIPADSEGLYSHFTVTSCSSSSSGLTASSSSSLRRIAYLAAQAEGIALPSTAVVISCIPSYTYSSATLNINSTTSSLINYAIDGALNDLEPQFPSVSLIEKQIPLQLTDDPSASTSSDSFGQLIIQATQKSNTSVFDPNHLLQLIPDAYSTFFAQTIATYLMSPASNEFTGLVLTTEIRLAVFSLAARLLGGLLALVLLSTFASLYFSQSRRVEISDDGMMKLTRGFLLFHYTRSRPGTGDADLVEEYLKDGSLYGIEDGTVKIKSASRVTYNGSP